MDRTLETGSVELTESMKMLPQKEQLKLFEDAKGKLE